MRCDCSLTCKSNEGTTMSTRQKLNKKIARQIREEIAEAIHASAERIAEIRKNSSPNRQMEPLISVSGK